MEKLFSNYSVSEVIMFIIVLALAIKGLVTFIDWGYDRLKKHFKSEQKEEQEKDKINDNILQQEKSINHLIENQQQLQKEFSLLNKKVDMLIQSDMDSIKSYLTEKHHFFCLQQKWIDDYNLECCEKRYSHYKEEGGNSFITGFMTELRELPKQPPKN